MTPVRSANAMKSAPSMTSALNSEHVGEIAKSSAIFHTSVLRKKNEIRTARAAAMS